MLKTKIANQLHRASLKPSNFPVWVLHSLDLHSSVSEHQASESDTGQGIHSPKSAKTSYKPFLHYQSHGLLELER